VRFCKDTIYMKKYITIFLTASACLSLDAVVPRQWHPYECHVEFTPTGPTFTTPSYITFTAAMAHSWARPVTSPSATQFGSQYFRLRGGLLDQHSGRLFHCFPHAAQYSRRRLRQHGRFGKLGGRSQPCVHEYLVDGRWLQL